MERTVKRKYDGSGRRASSARTRQRIIDAARTLVDELGYRRATVARIAERAEVSVATVYELVGRKPAILRELIEQTISGTDRAVGAEDREYVRQITAEPDAEAKLAGYAAAVTRILHRMAPLFLAVREASATDAEARSVWNEIIERRAANMRLLAADLAATGRLRPGLSVDEIADVIWATNSAEFYVLLTVERGWSDSLFEEWLTEIWQRVLLD